MEDPHTIYVVTTGSYSDYRIFGVYSTQEKAELAAENAADSTIETYILDGDIDHLARHEKLITVMMHRDGTTEEYISERTKGEEMTTLQPYYGSLQKRRILVVSRWVDRVESVVKIANEHRMRYNLHDEETYRTLCRRRSCRPRAHP